MASIDEKAVTRREAVAKCEVHLNQSTLKKVMQGTMTKGDVLMSAQIAGILGAKKTAELLPLCHPLNITHVDIEIQAVKNVKQKQYYLEITSTVRIDAKTGVEMEALTACSIAALTIYDMCKPLQKDICITNMRLIRKTGGKSGTYTGK